MASFDIQWSEIFSVHDEQLDAEHLQQFNLIEHFSERCNVSSVCDKVEQKQLMAKLIDLATDHFLAEEEALRTLHGKTPNDHSLEHQTLLKELHKLEERIYDNQSGDSAITYPAILIGWFVRHMMIHDAIDCRAA